MVDLFFDWKEGIRKILMSMGIEGYKLQKNGDQERLMYHYDE